MNGMKSGWIKLHRSLLNWKWINNSNTLSVFIYLLLRANHQKNTYKNTVVQIGSLVTGRKSIAKMTGLSEQKVRTALVNLQTTNEITIKTTNKYSVISINNWDKYQAINQQKNRKSTNKQPHYKNDKEIKNNNINWDEFGNSFTKRASDKKVIPLKELLKK
jgi:hypothetical protein